MKKKGRVSGTIGFILAVALVGGTVVYSSMFDVFAAGKSSKPFGDATGSVITGFTGGDGFSETKTLVNDTIVQGSGEKYKSYTLDFDISNQYTTEANGKTVVTVYNESGTYYYDGAYAYAKVDVSLYTEGKVQVNSYAYIQNVENGEVWYRQGTDPQTSTGADLPVGVEWSKTPWATEGEVGFTFLEIVSGVGEGFCALNNVKFNFLTGQYEQEIKAANVSALYSFTVGVMPKIYYCSTIEKAAGVTQYGTANVTLTYSNLNNTTVVVPSAVKGE